MIYAICADLHIGNHKLHGGQDEAGINKRCRATLDALTMAMAAGIAYADCLAILGDVFDADKPSPQILAETARLLRPTGPNATFEVTALLGNHDMRSDAKGDHALGPLGRAGIKVIDEIFFDEDNGVLWVPFAGKGTKDILEATIDQHRPRVVFGHFGIADDKTAPWLLEADDAVPVRFIADLMKRFGTDFVAAGNWHTRQKWQIDDKVILQVGALCPADHGDKPPFGTLAIYDSESKKLTIHDVAGPRFASVKFPSDKLPKIPCAAQLFIKLIAHPSDREAAEAALAFAVESGEVTAGVVETDNSDIAEAMKSAAQAASSALSVSESLREYVKVAGMPPSVATRCASYLGIQ